MSDYYPADVAPHGETLPLFKAFRSRQSATSADAAAVAGKRRETIAARVLELLANRGPSGATDEEIRHALELGESTARPRRHELVAAGHVVDSGQKRRSTKGCLMIVWVLPEHRRRSIH